MTTLLAILGLAALFVVFGVFRLAGHGGCGDCSCDEGTCRPDEDEGVIGPGIY